MQLDATAFRIEDWYPRYGLRPQLPASDDLFLSEAVLVLGEHLALGFDPDYPLLACMPSIPVVPDVHEAFANGEPVAWVHEIWSHRLRAVADLQHDLGSSLIGGDGEAWIMLAQLRALGVDRLARFFAEIAESRAPRDASSQVIDDDDWASLAFEAEGIREYGTAARTVMGAIGAALTELIADASIEVYARPPGGSGHTIAIGPDLWNSDAPLHHVASCSIDPYRPSDPSAKGTHLIFVRKAGFLDGITPYARDHRLELPAAGLAATKEVAYVDMHQALVADILHLLSEHGNANWRKPHLLAALPKLNPRWSGLETTVFERARAEVGETVNLNRKDGRLSRLEEAELKLIHGKSDEAFRAGRDASSQTAKRIGSSGSGDTCAALSATSTEPRPNLQSRPTVTRIHSRMEDAQSDI